MNPDIGKEMSAFIDLNDHEKLTWLAKLLFYISMFARDTYQAGTDQLNNPSALRKFNELIHRISSFQLAIALKKSERIPDEQFFILLDDSLSEINISTASLLTEMNK